MKARWIVAGAIAGLVVSIAWVVGSALFEVNPERLALHRELFDLEDQLLKRKAIFADLPRYRAERARMLVVLEERVKTMSPDLEIVFAQLRAVGVDPQRGPSRVQEVYTRVEIELKGPTVASLGAAADVLEDWSLLRKDATLFVTPSGAWTWGSTVFAYFETTTPAPTEPPIERAWYSALHDDLRQEVAKKRAEIEALDRQIGLDEIDAGKTKRLLSAYDRIAPQMIDFTPLIRLGFTQAPPLLKFGEIMIDNNDQSVVLSGPRARDARGYSIDRRWSFLEGKEDGRLVTHWKWNGLVDTSTTVH